ncbi:helix-turn-helix domain-containing protein [Streptomyces sp. SID4919]|uniref:ATP-binding protein n=1 Tax=Streptomyces sp. AmelKG-E11A TaxID=1100822 RepID=UPI000823D75C|nr:helix-turn-helix domain-containing protein [Streptomyces sp. SID4919]SCK63349.1 Signal transduction histidine kinase [Streptomyces sp. AmelKG-E11A]
MTVWANRLREFYKSLGLTLVALEDLLGIDATTISRYLNGQRIPEITFLKKLDDAIHRRTGARLRPEVMSAVRTEYLAACLMHEPQRHEVYVLRDELDEARSRLAAAEQTVAELQDQITGEQRRRQELTSGLRELEAVAASGLHDAETLRRERDTAMVERDLLDELLQEHLVELKLASRDRVISLQLEKEVSRVLIAAEEALEDVLAEEDAATGHPPARADTIPDRAKARWWKRTSSADLARLREQTSLAAREHIPDLVQQLNGWDPEEPLDLSIPSVGSYISTEAAQLAAVIDSLLREAARLAAEQAVMRGSVNAMFSNLSRRSQALIQRQLSLISELESREADPDQLTSLFKLDHLATRMRRNGENLLVLAGEEPGRRWTRPVPLVDVLRSAAGEVEQYERIELSTVPGTEVTGRAVNDLVHLLAELLENATSFSPPQTKVKVTGHTLPDGRVLVEIRDAGIGLSPENLAAINERLASPPTVDISVYSRMGLFVAGRLSQRHGIRVQLHPAGTSGTSALAVLPVDLVQYPSAGPDGVPAT